MSHKLKPAIADQLLTVALATPDAQIFEDAFYSFLNTLTPAQSDNLSNLYIDLVMEMLRNAWSHGFDCGHDPRLLVFEGGAR